MSKNETTLWRYSVDFNTGGEGDFRYKKIGIPCELTGDCFYGELGGRPESLRSTLSQKSCGKVFSDSDNEFHVFLTEENDELAKSLLAEKVRARHEELKALYLTSHNTIWFLEAGPREQKEQKIRAEKEKFEKIVVFLAETYYKSEEDSIDDEINDFEYAIEASGYNHAFFGEAKSKWNEIRTGYQTPRGSIIFTADYDDQTVCEWEGSYEEFEKLFRETAPTVYEMYQTRLSESSPESSMMLDC